MRILAINVEIGYGHPNYLDYVLQAIKEIAPKTEIKVWNVLTHEKGLTRLFWQMSKQIYTLGAKGGMITGLYNKIRNLNKTPNLPLCTANTQGFDRIIVSHPLLAKFLGSVWYVHAEIALPKESVLTNVEKIIVPIEYTGKQLLKNGVKQEQVIETGLLIANELVDNAQQNYKKRLSRIRSKQSLTIGFFISGAYPKPHINKTIDAVYAVTKKNFRTIMFLGTNPKKASQIIAQLHHKYPDIANSKTTILFIQGKNRVDYQKKVHRLLPLLDAFVAPSHEYTNWAIGLGLPMFALFPMIGSYAPKNFDFLFKQGVTYPIKTNHEAQNLGDILENLRKTGELSQMVKNGINKFPIDGAIKTAQIILRLT
ncbi:MAG: hypothetical protein KGZ86_08195 [Candidatus Latescibacteria bacterium]|nr:hypothetical protein [Candidatus Latescibacterota bacterium]